MAPKKGNRFWELRTKHGKDKIFTTEGILWDAACEYFAWCEDTPLLEDKPFQFQGVLVPSEVAKMRAMTIDGLCLFLDIAPKTWYEYAKLDDYSNITARIESVIKSQKFAGAAAGLLNPTIIARDLGLRDLTGNEHTGKDGGPIQYTDLTEDALDLRIAALTQETEE